MAEATLRVVEHLKLRVSMPRAFGLRMWMTSQALRIAGLVSPIDMEIEVIDKKSEKEIETTIIQESRWGLRFLKP